jgi:hypothetical protein
MKNLVYSSGNTDRMCKDNEENREVSTVVFIIKASAYRQTCRPRVRILTACEHPQTVPLYQ